MSPLMKIFLLAVLASLANLAFGFHNANTHRVAQRSVISMQHIDIVTRDGLVLSDTLKSRINSKISKVISKLGPNILNSATVTLRLNKYPVEEKHSSITKKNSQICEVHCALKGGATVEASMSCDDMYASIDLASHTLAKNLKKHRATMKDKRKNPKIGGSVSADEVDEDDALLAFDEETLLAELDDKYRSLLR